MGVLQKTRNSLMEDAFKEMHPLDLAGVKFLLDLTCWEGCFKNAQGGERLTAQSASSGSCLRPSQCWGQVWSVTVLSLHPGCRGLWAVMNPWSSHVSVQLSAVFLRQPVWNSCSAWPSYSAHTLPYWGCLSSLFLLTLPACGTSPILEGSPFELLESSISDTL